MEVLYRSGRFKCLLLRHGLEEDKDMLEEYFRRRVDVWRDWENLKPGQIDRDLYDNSRTTDYLVVVEVSHVGESLRGGSRFIFSSLHKLPVADYAKGISLTGVAIEISRWFTVLGLPVVKSTKAHLVMITGGLLYLAKYHPDVPVYMDVRTCLRRQLHMKRGLRIEQIGPEHVRVGTEGKRTIFVPGILLREGTSDVRPVSNLVTASG